MIAIFERSSVASKCNVLWSMWFSFNTRYRAIQPLGIHDATLIAHEIGETTVAEWN